MKRITRHGIVAVVAIAISVLTGSVVLAQETTPQSPETPVTTQEARQSREQRVQQVQRSLERCTQIANRLEERVNKTAEVKAAHTERYDRLVTRLDAVIANAETRSYDTSGLDAAKSSVVTAISAYGTAIDTYIESLTKAQALTCEESVTTYAQSITDSRDALAAVRTAGAEVKSTFRLTVVPELQEYKAWLEQNAASSEENVE